MNKLNLYVVLLSFCVIFTNVFYKLHSKYFYAYDTINNIYLEHNFININLIGFGMAMIIAFAIYKKLRIDESGERKQVKEC